MHSRRIHADTLSQQRIASLLVDNGTLGVHHVVIFQQPLPYAEIVFLDFLLGAFDGAGNHGMLDRQLRGRAGRQGDPGSSQFFVSLEDDLMRLFSSERIIRVMDRLGHKEGDVIQHRFTGFRHDVGFFMV